MSNKKICWIQMLTYQSPKVNYHFNELFFEIVFQDRSFFSSLIQNTKNTQTKSINDHFFFEINVQTKKNEILKIIRWESQHPIFIFQIEVSDLIKKSLCKKKIQIRNNQYLELCFNIVEQHSILQSNKQCQGLHHYFILDSLKTQENNLLHQQNQGYFKIHVNKKIYLIPRTRKNSKVIFQLPAQIQFQYYSHTTLTAKSSKIKSKDLISSNKFDLFSGDQKNGVLNVIGKFGQNKNIITTTYQQFQQLLLYDIELNLYKDNTMADETWQLRAFYTNKVYEIQGQKSSDGKVNFKKIIFISPIYSLNDFITIKLYKKNVQYSNFTLFVSEFTNNSILQKSINSLQHNKLFANLKLKTQKEKTINTPEINKYWRETLKKPISSSYILNISQISFYNPRNIVYDINFTVGQTNYSIDQIFIFSDEKQQNANKQKKNHYEFEVKQQLSLYISLKKNKKDLEGIGIVDITELKLGLNPLQVLIYKQKKIIGNFNLIINKIPNLKFCKAISAQGFQSIPKIKERNITVQIKEVVLNGYFYTYAYENKSEFVCRIQINNIQKRLNLENLTNNQLLFNQGINGDYLNFCIQESEYSQINFNFIVSDFGIEQVNYGESSVLVKSKDLMFLGILNFQGIGIKNKNNMIIGAFNVNIKTQNYNKKKLESYKKRSSLNLKKLNSSNKDITESINKISKRYLQAQHKNINIQNKNKLPKINKSMEPTHPKKRANKELKKIKQYDSDEQLIEKNILQLEQEISINKIKNEKKKVVEKIIPEKKVNRRDSFHKFLHQTNIQINDKNFGLLELSPKINHQFGGLKSIYHQLDQLSEIQPTINQTNKKLSDYSKETLTPQPQPLLVLQSQLYHPSITRTVIKKR